MNIKKIFPCLSLAIWVTLTPLTYAQNDDNNSHSELSDDALLAILDRYIGTWEGNLEIKDSADKTLQTMTIQQVYWWEKTEDTKILKGQTVLSNRGALSFAHSECFVYKNNIYSVSKQNETEQSNRAIIENEDLQIRWIPTRPGKLKRETIETFAESSRDIFIHIEGIEDYPTEQGIIRLSMSGSLKRIDLKKEIRKEEFYKSLKEIDP